MFSFIHTYIVSKSPGGGFYAFSFTPFPPDPEKSRYRRRFFLLRFSFWLCSVPLYLPCAPKGSPSFSLCCAGDTCFFRFDARPLLCCRKLGALLPGKREDSRRQCYIRRACHNAWFAASPEENIIYLTFDCGYENGNTPAILDALQKHQAPAVGCRRQFSLRPAGSCQTHGGRRPYRRKPHLVAPGYVQNFHAGSLLRRAEPCFRSLPGDHQPEMVKFLPASAGKNTARRTCRWQKDLRLYQTFL